MSLIKRSIKGSIYIFYILSIQLAFSGFQYGSMCAQYISVYYVSSRYVRLCGLYRAHEQKTTTMSRRQTLFFRIHDAMKCELS